MQSALLASGALCAVDSVLQKSLEEYLPRSTTVVLPAAYAGVIAVNVVGSGFALTKLGFEVGKARKQYGVEYPTMYADSSTKEGRAFNCVQRGHQQALETYPQFLALSLIGGVQHPLLTTAAGAAWIAARLQWAKDYAEHGPEGRYNAKYSRFIWYSMIAGMVASLSTAAHIARGK